uniref:Uncharacterized protein n=1 Tax=viral metagenome TaxID=1070528 RepID=A0A6H1ZHV9_9ZZZZ
MTKEDILDSRHWKFEDYRQRIPIESWKELLLNYDDGIIFKGRLRQLKIKKLGSGVVEVFKMPIYAQPETRKPNRDKDYLLFIAKKPCLHCGAYPAGMAHHVRWSDDGWMATKPDDRNCIPLCPTCHDLVHNDPATFARTLGREDILAEMFKNLKEWDDGRQDG